MKNELLFFERDDFYAFKELKKTEGYEIISITDFIKDNNLAEDFDCNSHIVDLSILSTYNQLQYVGEEIIRLFDNDTIFIADKKHEDIFKYELRYCFLEFKDVAFIIPKSYSGESSQKKQLENVNKKHKKIIDLTEEELSVFLNRFREALYGHEKFKDDFTELINTFRIFNKLGEHKILSLFILGESGVGKTEVARTIYRCFDGKKKLAKVNFGNYSSEFSLSSLIGSSRGYIGSDDGEIFIRVRDTDIGVILIDEFEKSNAALFNYFLDVLESGKIVSSLAEEIDLNGFIIVFTSNINKEDFPQRISPELRSRFDYKGQFTLLYDKDKEKYVEFRVKNIAKKVNLEFNKELPDNLHEYFLNQIDVSKFTNMRDLNKKIKRVFLDYISIEHEPNVEIEDAYIQSKMGLGRKIANLFKP